MIPRYNLIVIIVMLMLTLLLGVMMCGGDGGDNSQNGDPDNPDISQYIIADTGQGSCWDASGNVIACDEDPAGYPRQDGYWTDKPNARSFTGPTQHPTYTSNYTTKDNVTSLVWKSCTEGWDGVSCANDNADPNVYSWDNASTACTALNALNGGAGYAGRTTWRLPSVQELKTILNYGVYNPAIDTSRFPSTPVDAYWSSSTYVTNSAYAWTVDFGHGLVSAAYLKSGSRTVRCVADGP